ncbi:MAG: radical SAM protein, partial [Myxococcota bacterium]|nr:radical SAM protein [Myxococcota bacterium]
MSAPRPSPVVSSAPPPMPGSYLVVELTNRCSLACVHCSVSEDGHEHHARTGYIDPEIFFDLVDDLEALGARFDTLIPFWLGEPLLHPHFTAIWRRGLRAAALHGTFSKVEVHTNATHLSAARTAALLNDSAIPTVLHFSLDAATRDTYLRIKGLDRFDQVEANVSHFITEKGRTGARGPRPVFQFIVGSNNVEEAGAFRQRWEAVCRNAGVPVVSAAGHVPAGEEAVVFFRQLDCPTAAEQARENAVFRAAMAEQGLSLPPQAEKGETVETTNLLPCSGLWKSPVVSWKGELTTCTRDNRLENQVGRLTEARFRDLWWGGKMAGRRDRVAVGDYDGLALCATCFIPRSLNHADLEPVDIA